MMTVLIILIMWSSFM